MSLYERKQAKILIFTSDGYLMEGDAFTLEFTQSTEGMEIRSDTMPPVFFQTVSNIELSATMTPEVVLTQTIEDYKETLEKRKAEFLISKKFQCEWCGTIQGIENKTCFSCGGWRPIFFELLDLDDYR